MNASPTEIASRSIVLASPRHNTQRRLKARHVSRSRVFPLASCCLHLRDYSSDAFLPFFSLSLSLFCKCRQMQRVWRPFRFSQLTTGPAGARCTPSSVRLGSSQCATPSPRQCSVLCRLPCPPCMAPHCYLCDSEGMQLPALPRPVPPPAQVTFLVPSMRSSRGLSFHYSSSLPVAKLATSLPRAAVRFELQRLSGCNRCVSD